jgi:PTH1 family peptidyl-tRNA hydrolase
MGVGQKPHPDYDISDWVLSDMNREELKVLREACNRACDAIELIVRGEMEEAMGRYSG